MRIAIIRTSSIGDVILASACLDYLSKTQPDAEISWLGREPSLSLIRQSWPKIAAIPFGGRGSELGFWSAVNRLRSFDVVCDLQTSLKTRLLTAVLRRLGVVIGTPNKLKRQRWESVFFARLRGRCLRLKPAAKQFQKHQWQAMLDALEVAMARHQGNRVSAAASAARPRLPAEGFDAACHPALVHSALKQLGFGEWLAVAPGASHPTKRAPSEVFRDILRDFSNAWPKDRALPGMVFVGGGDDRDAANQLLDQLSWDGPTLNVAGKLTLPQTSFMLAASKGLLSNDSGLAHLAESLNIPVAMLFGPTIESFGFAPQLPQSAAFSADLGCRPCSRHGKAPCRYEDHLCFRSLDTNAVALFIAKGFFGVTRS